MKIDIPTKLIFLLMSLFVFTGCENSSGDQNKTAGEIPQIVGTWKLISGTVIREGDTIITDYTQGQEMIKIINDTHFAFLRHDLNGGSDSTEVFVAGGGTYEVNKNTYIEHLDYFNLRDWEGNHFEFEYAIVGDTLVTQGVEEVKDLNVKYYNIEKYCRLKN